MINLLTEDIVLEDKRAQLIALNNTHLPAFINYAITEPDTWRYSLVSPGSSKTAMENYVAYALKERLENKGYPFAIIDKQTHEIAGCSRFYDIDFTHKIATIGYTWYGQKFRRTGLNRHCKLLMLSYAFEVWNLERVEFRADINNTPSIKAMKEIGCLEEGILRSHAIIENGRRTSMILSILKDEWFGGVKENLIKKIY